MELNDQTTPESTEVEYARLSAEQSAGMWLAKMLLWMIACIILLYALLFLFHGCGHCREPAINSTTAACKVCGAITGKDSHIHFAFGNLQFIINVLCPIFTTVLGYIFGTRARS